MSKIGMEGIRLNSLPITVRFTVCSKRISTRSRIFLPSGWMTTSEHRLELPPEAELARDFIEALVARYESRIEELKQQVRALSEQVSLSRIAFKNRIHATRRCGQAHRTGP